MHPQTEAPTSPVEPAAPLATPPALSLRAYLVTSGATPIVIAVVIVGMFLPVVLSTYAFIDDYPLLWTAVSGEPSAFFGRSIFYEYAVGGRPLAGLLTAWSYTAAGGIDALQFVRLAGVVGIAAVALQLHWTLVRSGFGRALAALIAVLVCSMPAFQLTAAWTVLFHTPLAMLLAGGASVLAAAAIDAPHRLRNVRMIGATAMLLASLMIYQPAAMFFWVVLAIAIVGERNDARRAMRTTLAHLVAGGVALALAFVSAKVFVAFFDNGGTAEPRGRLTTDILGKAGWFLDQPLYQTLNLFDLTPSPRLAAVVAAVAAGGMLLWLVRRSPQPLLYIVIALALIPLSFLPNLIVAENHADIRSQIALSPLVTLYVCLGALGLWLTLRDWIEPHLRIGALRVAERAALAIATIAVGGSVVAAASHVTNLIVVPQTTELRMIRSQVAALPVGTTRVAFVLTPYQTTMAPLINHEIGLPIASLRWVLQPLVRLILHERGSLPPWAPRPIVDVLPSNTTTYPVGVPVIDVRGIRRFR